MSRSSVHEASRAVALIFGRRDQVPPGISERQLEDFRLRVSAELPPSVTAFYREMNGTPGHTPVELGWIRIWPLEEVSLARDIVGDELPGFAVIADHGECAWYYAVPVRTPREGPVPVFRIGVGEPEQVSDDFERFLRQVAEGASELLD